MRRDTEFRWTPLRGDAPDSGRYAWSLLALGTVSCSYIPVASCRKNIPRKRSIHIRAPRCCRSSCIINRAAWQPRHLLSK